MSADLTKILIEDKDTLEALYNVIEDSNSKNVIKDTIDLIYIQIASDNDENMLVISNLSNKLINSYKKQLKK